MALTKVEVDKFKEGPLLGINKKRNDLRNNAIKAGLSILLLTIITFTSISFIKFLRIWFLVIIIIAFIIWMVYWIFLSTKISNENLTRKEKTLYRLYQSLFHLEKFIIEQNIKDYRKAKKILRSFKNYFSETDFNIFGTRWEGEANNFVHEIVRFLDVEIIPKLRIDARKQLLEKLYNNLQMILKAIMLEEFKDIDHNTKKINKKFSVVKKSIKERLIIVIREKTIIKVFFALTIVVLTFFAIWGISIFKNYQIDFFVTLGISVLMPAAIHYGILVFDKLLKKG